MRVKNWDYRELRERIADGLTLRQFTDFYCRPVPKHDAFQRGFIAADATETLKAVNDLVVQAAVEPRIGGRHEAACRHHGGADRYSSSDRQHVAVGCGARRHTLGPPSGQSAGPADGSRGFAIAHGRRGGGCTRSSA